MFKILTKKLNVDTEEFLEGELTTSVIEKLKLRAPVAMSRLMTDFLTYILEPFIELNLLLSRYSEMMTLSAHLCSRAIACWSF